MDKKGLTISFIIEAESANYGEGIGNVSSLKKLTRSQGESYTYISRQALRYNIINQCGYDTTKLSLDKEVIQYAPDAHIDEYPEIDFFGYMKTLKGEDSKTRSAVVRLSNAIALEPFSLDLDFLSNKGLLDRYNMQNENKKKGSNLAQSEIHKSYYTYTITIDLDKIGIDKVENIEIDNSEKSNRVCNLLDTIKFLYRDIRGRRENLSPILAIGGVYNIKNPFFHNRLILKDGNFDIDTIRNIYTYDEEVENKTKVGVIESKFNNGYDIKEKLNAKKIGEFFEEIKKEVKDYYIK
ncbi:type I-B CRISPR-associated protein Cas7/Cst2/DevR [Tepiditoga spiralis]|uniref:Type I-B CRISPR-associated protein Cas7/Cst2/DevR n=1 Tax=Tepiditoga spiralis TaxID=2108365 RepID=A0A7G1G7H5_9BACT|nr:type I-B CRISPR-associated protein Cas7/Cst2/DevR [Tepiditoga spiralis]BBE29972.1 type I-B CRISPR-associated protein Cas7/Cst2/DevR [Tepiditoga spiralis]